MKRPKRIKGACGENFVQSEYVQRGIICMDCPEACLTTDLINVHEECKKTCKAICNLN